MYKILFIQEFDWQPMQSSWGSWDIPSPYFDDTHNGWMLPDGWQEHLTERGIAFEEINLPEPT
jgi:hypothetical protein